MLSLSPRRQKSGSRSRGFTMVELMVTLSIMAIAFAIGVPSLSDWIRNNEVRAVANGLQNSIRTAQSEALRRNRQVVLVLTDDRPTESNSAVTAKANGKFWATYTVPLDGSGEAKELIDTGALSDVGAKVELTGPSALCFNSLGRLSANTSPADIDGAACTLPSGSALHSLSVTRPEATRELNVQVSVGGQVRMCNPNRALASYPDGCA